MAEFPPTAAKPARSIASLWAMWGALMVVMLAPPILGAPPALTSAIMMLAAVLSIPLVYLMRERGMDAYNADLPLFGLEEVERPRMVLGRGGAVLMGQLALRGRRWGRAVFVTVDASSRKAGTLGASVVTVAAPSPRFEITGDGGRLRAAPGAPAPVLLLLDAIGHAAPWHDITVRAGPEGISVSRGAAWRWLPSPEKERRWLYDLWLAEHLARVVSSGG
jgi:hypothetical protein